MSSAPLRFAIFGAGIWARVQLAAWREVGGVECVAVWNRSRDRAESFARDLGVPALRTLERFLHTDLGVHLLETARACFGEAHSVYCQTQQMLRPR
ncbi:MAG: Gfo/Idh/MocA family oxidoreductase [Verrucomicrobia bacterium]|nr:Gfo/Idh/MocA family oxidoreductase [Verrucomicrobiota bacterium]